MLSIDKNKIVFFFFLFILFLSCHKNKPQELQKSDFIFNTFVTIRVFEPDNLQPELLDSAFSAMKQIERISNFYSETSLLSRLNHNLSKGAVHEKITDEFRNFLTQSLTVCQMTEGGLDISIGKVSALWPFGQENAKPPSAEEVKDNLRYVNYKQIHIENGFLSTQIPEMQLDLSATNKGFGVDQAIRLLKNKGVKTAIVDAGGNLGILWARRDSMKVYIRHPEDPGKMIGYIWISDPISVATSGNYMNTFDYRGKRYHHVLDPKSGFPSDSALSVTVFAKSAAMADGLGTGLFVKGPKFTHKFINSHPEFNICYINNSRNIYLSSYLKQKFRLLDSTYTVHRFNE